MADKTPGLRSERVGEIPTNKISHGMLQDLQKMPGVETNLVENPSGEPKIEVTVNSIVLPPKKK